jgi:two-component system, OmpR family, response regulator
MRVLVVDDHPDAADALAAVLELLGCPVRTCYNGRTALMVAAEFDPQVCLLDLMMPGMDGLELAARLKSQAAGRPLLLVATTALGDAEAQALTALAGFHYHLTKPVDVCVLIEALTQLGKIIARPTNPDTTTTD